MGRLNKELLERYHDGELSERARQRVEAQLAQSPEDQASLARLQKLGDLLRVMNEESVTAASFEGFEQRVLAGLSAERRPGLGERLRVWVGEFFEHRRVVWIPSAAVAAVAATVMLVFAFVSTPQVPQDGTAPGASYADADGFVVREAAAPSGSEIVSVNFGSGSGFATTVQGDSGEAVGVVWINE